MTLEVLKQNMESVLESLEAYDKLLLDKGKMDVSKQIDFTKNHILELLDKLAEGIKEERKNVRK